ncbi:hypothetical protein JTB14_006244 [Gonioctena quinquepunctata]|nr:hypothetical protein JTB14_006244 [Gonioctena quinquepunctata]
MEYNLKCQLCGKEICVTPETPSALGEHLLQNHPDVELTFFSCEEDGDSKAKCCKRHSKRKVHKVRKLSKMSTSIHRSVPARKKNIYKTTVETWGSGPFKVICPKCKRKARPCIRKQKNKVAHTCLGAFFMMTCWPICFLPFLLPNAGSVDFFCRHCGTYLGEYNKATGTLKCACQRKDKKAYDPRKMCSEFDS